MTRLAWGSNQARQFETGLDRGVLYLNSGEAVPWVGLTSVDENGSESAATYYRDGRLYLSVPKPKEFTGTLKAYMFPDEFGPCMGEIEATDGMYLDSQQSDSFNLSYRTLVGDGITGTEAGYKIHLLYNVTASPQSKTYESLSSSVNPTDMAWDITAVPVAVTGYRPTAHIIIDTRHLDATKLQQIEDLLYGTDTANPDLPSPQLIHDTLSYGTTITIVNNGDGTGSISGSYHYIYELSDGTYQVDNATGVDNHDGTYTLSS